MPQMGKELGWDSNHLRSNLNMAISRKKDISETPLDVSKFRYPIWSVN